MNTKSLLATIFFSLMFLFSLDTVEAQSRMTKSSIARKYQGDYTKRGRTPARNPEYYKLKSIDKDKLKYRSMRNNQGRGIIRDSLSLRRYHQQRPISPRSNYRNVTTPRSRQTRVRYRG